MAALRRLRNALGGLVVLAALWMVVLLRTPASLAGIGLSPIQVANAKLFPTDPARPTARPEERADRDFQRSYRAPLAGGVLFFPKGFASKDGRYDLVLHLNGNTDLVEESYDYSGLNAVVVILNLGVGSGVYEDRFADPAAFQLIESRVQNVMIERGLRHAHLGRVAVSAWSSGYGGVIKLLQREETFAELDAVVLFDAIFCGYDPNTKQLKPDQIEPITRFAKKAAASGALLSITHSEIETYGYYNARKTSDLVLERVGLARTPASTPQPMPPLGSMLGVLPRAKIIPLPPLSEAHQGDLHVRGYSGTGAATHALHLMQMSTTALPDLVKRWGRATP